MPSVELRNPALERMRAGDVALGMLVRLGRSGDIARIAKTTGHDFIFLDVQHAIYSLETIGHIAQAALGVAFAAATTRTSPSCSIAGRPASWCRT